MNLPLVTVITTFHNSQLTLRNSIESILSQTYKKIEYILVNDGSIDESESIVESFDDERILLLNPGKIGRAQSLNLALEQSKGKYIVILDADDIAFNTRLEKQLKVFAESRDTTLVFSNAELINSDSKHIGVTKFPIDQNLMLDSLYKLNPFPHSSVMFDKESVMSFGGYNERCEKSIDFNLYLEILMHSKKIIGINETLIKLTVSDNTWGKSDNSAKQIFYGIFGLSNFYMYERAGKNFLRSNKEDYDILYELFNQWFNLNNFRKKVNAKKSFHASIELLRKYEIIEGFNQLFNAFIQDPIFWTYKGINFSYPSDVNSFIMFIEKESDSLSKMIKNV